MSKQHIGKHAKMHIHWKVSPYDYTKEKENLILFQASQKYSIPKDRIKLIPEFIVLNKKGEEMSVAHEVVQNIQRPDFQIQLFKKYIVTNNIQGYNFNIIQAIDADINAKIDYEIYDKYRKYRIKWVKWKNFLSYGDGNSFDFSNLKGLVLLNGEPANQSGKTTFAIDLLHFLFFGKVEKYKTQDKIFNKHIPTSTEVVVEGCIEIEGTEYVIKRRLTRPALNKRTEKSKTTQKVDYYKIVNNELTALEDYVDNQQEENSIQTNKIIKEAIGNESDFDMIVCATNSNLDSLIEKKETECGRLLSRWIGLLPIEQKEQLAKEKFNTEIKPFLLSNKYNSEELLSEIELFKNNISDIDNGIVKNKHRLEEIDKEITRLEETQMSLLKLRTQIDDSLLRLDINTLNNKIAETIELGKVKKAELKEIVDKLEELEKVDFSIEEYNNLLEQKEKTNNQITQLRVECATLQKTIKDLHSSEYCPTCGRKYENIDNTDKINEFNEVLKQKVAEGVNLKSNLEEINKKIDNLKLLQEQYLEKCKLQVKKGAIEVSIEQYRNSYLESKKTFDEYKKNTEAIDRNNQLDIQINNNTAIINSKRQEKEVVSRNILNGENDIKNLAQGVKDREEIILKLKDEAVNLRNWRLYLEMVGKNGISKMLLRQVVPVINAQVSALLNEVCDFTVELTITDKNDIAFYLVKDGVRSDLTGGSGFERTASALALRSVLGNISTLPRMSSLVLDEIWGRVAKENYDNLRKLLEEIGKSFDFILLISHLDEVKDFCNTIITVSKKDNVSALKSTTNIVVK